MSLLKCYTEFCHSSEGRKCTGRIKSVHKRFVNKGTPRQQSFYSAYAHAHQLWTSLNGQGFDIALCDSCAVETKKLNRKNKIEICKGVRDIGSGRSVPTTPRQPSPAREGEDEIALEEGEISQGQPSGSSVPPTESHSQSSGDQNPEEANLPQSGDDNNIVLLSRPDVSVTSSDELEKLESGSSSSVPPTESHSQSSGDQNPEEANLTQSGDDNNIVLLSRPDVSVTSSDELEKLESGSSSSVPPTESHSQSSGDQNPEEANLTQSGDDNNIVLLSRPDVSVTSSDELEKLESGNTFRNVDPCEEGSSSSTSQQPQLRSRPTPTIWNQPTSSVPNIRGGSVRGRIRATRTLQPKGHPF